MKRPITPKGYVALREELKRLRSMRPELAKEIERARELGDLSENGDYDAAKERSGMTEAKIRDLEAKLAEAEIIDMRSKPIGEKVTFGVTVKIEDLDSGEGKKLAILGAAESNVEQGIISCESPLARSLIGKSVGDIVKVALPGGAREYEIREVFLDDSYYSVVITAGDLGGTAEA